MKIIQHENFTEIKPDNTYITDTAEDAVFEGLCGKDINIDDYHDITDEYAEELIKKLEEQNTTEEIEEEIEGEE